MQAENAWGPPPENLTLELNDVHVWRASLDVPDELLGRLALTLSEDERTRSGRFHYPVHWNRFIAGRGIQRVILAQYLGIGPREIRFRYSKNGKPELDGLAAESGIRFTVSNSESIALYALTLYRRIGVDVEYMRPLPDCTAISELFFSAHECEALRTLPRDLQEEAFFACWTRKEAYVKAVGDGLSMPLSQFDVTLAPGEPARLLHTRGDPAGADRWTLRALDPGVGYLAALAVEGDSRKLGCFVWGDSSSPRSRGAARP